MPTGGSTVDTDGISLLVTRAQTGDVAAFEQLLLRLHGPLRQYLNNLAGAAAAADDILQEVAFKVFRQIKHLREPRVFMAWTFRIATRVAFVHLKKTFLVHVTLPMSLTLHVSVTVRLISNSELSMWLNE